MASLGALPRAAALMAALRHPGDPTTEEGRARERYRRVALTAGASVAAKCITILAALVTVPLTLQYLGAERYGIWMIVSSFTMMLSFADMGLSNGLVNEIAAAHGRDDRRGIRRIVSSGYCILGLLCVVIVTALAIAYPFVAWPRLFNVTTPQAIAEAGPALATYMVCFALAIPLTLVQKVQTALQQGFYASLWQCAGSLFGMLCLFAVVWRGGSLPWLVAALAGAPLLVAIVNAVWFFSTRGRDIRPAPREISKVAIRGATTLGMQFFVIQILVALIFGLDQVIVAQVLGADAVASYAVPDRMFSIVSLVLGITLQPLWPAYSEAIARGHTAWVRKTLIRTVLIATIMATVAVSLLVAFGPVVLRFWVGDTVTAPLGLLLGLAAWKIAEAIGTTLAIYLNGTGKLKLQILVSIPTGIVMLGMKIWLVGAIGVAGIPWGAAIPYFLLTVIPVVLVVRRELG